jgi:hypothetical protein
LQFDFYQPRAVAVELRSTREPWTCDRLSAEDIDRFFRRWLARLPHPFTTADRTAGMRYQLSILQMEVSLTQVFDRSLHGREFFEEVIRDNLDVGRPDRVQLLFGRRITRRTPGHFRTVCSLRESNPACDLITSTPA